MKQEKEEISETQKKLSREHGSSSVLEEMESFSCFQKGKKSKVTAKFQPTVSCPAGVSG